MKDGVQGRKVLVTGGASGIGLEVARSMSADGARVAIVDIDDDKLQRAADELGRDVAPLRADVRNAHDVQSAVERAVEAFGGLDTLVCSAGVIHVKALADVTEADWDFTLDINLKGTFFCCQAAAPALSAGGRGRIVIISSDAGKRGSPRLHAYSASKFGVIGLAESLAAELAPNVTVNCICPVGIPTTGMGQDLLAFKASETGRSPDAVLSGIARGLPMGRNATPGDVADAVRFFVSDGAAFITGVALDVDGGESLGYIPGTD